MRIVPVLLSTMLICGVWLLVDGNVDAAMLASGVVGAFTASVVAARMHILDDEGLPIGILWRLPRAVPGLLVQILSANVKVARIILDPTSAAPATVRISSPGTGAALLATHANFITLAPGTVAVAAYESSREIVVHGLTPAFLEPHALEKTHRLVSRLTRSGAT